MISLTLEFIAHFACNISLPFILSYVIYGTVFCSFNSELHVKRLLAFIGKMLC